MLSLYDVLLSLVVFGVLVPVEVVRIACGRSTWSRLELRLGLAKGEAAAAGGARESEARPVGSLVAHAVSAGEMQAAGILVAALCRRLPEIDVVLTAGTEDGLQVGEAIRRRCPQVRAVELLPWDRRRAVDRFLERHAPRLVVVVETEIWPGLFTACARRAVPLWVVSGRLRSRDVRRYRLAPRFFRRVLGAASWIGVQSAEQRRRFLAIGAPEERVEVVGNLKYGVEAGATAEPGARWTERCPVLVAVSTHHPEERFVLDALCSLRRTGRALRLVLAPRKVRRAAALRAAAERRGLRAVLSGELDENGPAWDVLVVDRLGELGPWLEASELAFVGGSLAARGGHNPLEPAAAGCAILVGPSTEHFREEVAELEAAGALVRVAGASELERHLVRLLDDEGRRRVVGRRAAAYVAGRRAHALAYAERVAELLGRVERPPN